MFLSIIACLEVALDDACYQADQESACYEGYDSHPSFAPRYYDEADRLAKAIVDLEHAAYFGGPYGIPF